MCTITTEVDTARLFLTDYASYNNGSQFEFGHWVDLSQFSDASEFMDYIEKHFEEADKKSPLFGTKREEIMFTDFEGFPKYLYGESMGEADLESIFLYIEADLDDDQELALEWLVNDIGKGFEDAIKLVDDVCLFKGSASDYAYELIDDCYDLPDFAKAYFDYDKFGRDLEIGGDIIDLSYNTFVTNARDF